MSKYLEPKLGTEKHFLIVGSGIIAETLATTLLADCNKVTMVTNQLQTKSQTFGDSNLKILTREAFLDNSTRIDSIEVAIIAARPERWKAADHLLQVVTRLTHLSLGHVILLSSSAVYGDSTNPFSETSTPEPLTDYGKSRLYIEEILSTSYPAEKLAILRLSNIYGSQNLRSLIEEITKCIKGDLAVELRLDPHALRDYLHIQDLISGLSFCVSQKTVGCFNLSTGKGVSVEELASLISERFAYSLSTKRISSSSIFPTAVILDNTKFRVTSGWSPADPFPAILDYIELSLGR